MKIYRYRNISNNTYNEIENKEFWFSKYSYLNDPFEGIYINKSGENHLSQLITHFEICCFSKLNNNLLMWAHYSNLHQGICIEFEIDEKEYSTSFFEVNYSNDQPILNKIRRQKSGHLAVNINDEAKIFLTKSKDWEYEKEIRTIRIVDDNMKNGSLHKIAGKITGIYCGLNTKEQSIIDLNRLLLDSQEIKFHQAILVNEQYKLDFKIINRSNLKCRLKALVE